MISRFRRLFDTAANVDPISWEDLFAEFSRPAPFQGDREHPGWAPTEFEPAVRALAHVKRVHAMVLDYDNTDPVTRDRIAVPVSLDDAEGQWGEFYGLIHATRKHKPEWPRFRVILPYSRHVSPGEHTGLWFRVNAHVGGTLDPSPKDPSRFWYTPGGLNFEARKLTGALFDPTEWLARPDPTLSGQPIAGPGIANLSVRETRARAYLSKMPEAVSGQGGHNALWSATRKLVADFELDEDTAYRLLFTEYNPRCQPPWSEKDLRHKVKQASRARVSKPVEPDRVPPNGAPRAPAAAWSPERARAELEPEPAAAPPAETEPEWQQQLAATLAAPEGPEQPLDDERPIVENSVNVHVVVDHVIAALAANPHLYQRDGELVRVLRVPETEADATVLAGTPVIRKLAVATLRESITRTVRFQRFDARSGNFRACVPPDNVVQAIASRGEYKGVRPLVGIAEAPMLRPDGTVLESAGYDSSTGYIYLPSTEFKHVEERPTQDDARRALSELVDVFCDFPYRGEADRFVSIAAILTLLARPAIIGSVPAFLTDANTPGTGKTLCNDVVSIVATGRPAAKMSFPTDNAPELEKILGSCGLLAAPIIAFDNVDGRFGGAPLDKVLTAGDTVQLRVLGKSEVPMVRWRTLVLASGNNLEAYGDTTRRVLVSRLETPLERPEDRQGFRHENLLQWVTAERPRLVNAALTVLRAWVAAGRPRGGCKSWGSFESWAGMIPPAIVFAGGTDPMGCRLTDGGEDPERRALMAVLQQLPRLAPDGISVKALVEALYPLERLQGRAGPDGYDDLREALEALVPAAPGRAPSAIKLAGTLRRFKRRVVSGRRLDVLPGHAGTVKWIVRNAISGGVGGVGGDFLLPTRASCPEVRGEGVEITPPTPPTPPVGDLGDIDPERDAIQGEMFS